MAKKSKKEVKKPIIKPNENPPAPCPKGYFRNSQGDCQQDPGA